MNNTRPDVAQEETDISDQSKGPRNDAMPRNDTMRRSDAPGRGVPDTIGVYERPRSPLLAQPILLTLVILFLIVTAVLFVLFVVL